ncbi:MAG TPA: hypothetical protein VNM49_13445, partial [Paenibacillus cookii]|nr:hypothetical protein [Paenibacillus cookii]
RGFKIASSVTEVGFSERFKSIFILKDMIPHIKNRVSKSPLDFLDTLKEGQRPPFLFASYLRP